MSKFPTGEEAITASIRDRIEATLAHQGHNLDWLAGEVGVSVVGLLRLLHDGPSYHILYDVAESLGVSTAYLAVGHRA